MKFGKKENFYDTRRPFKFMFYAGMNRIYPDPDFNITCLTAVTTLNHEKKLPHL